jgi:hypothetical protein
MDPEKQIVYLKNGCFKLKQSIESLKGDKRVLN